MDIKPSDTNRQFESGAVRGEDKGRGKPHLLPFAALTRIIRAGFGGAYSAPWTAIVELSKLYEAGSIKYPARNWERGMPCGCFVDSGIRHLQKHLRGDTDEPHLVQYCWNLCGLLQTHMWVIDGSLSGSLLDGLPRVKRQNGWDTDIAVEAHFAARGQLNQSFYGLSAYIIGEGLEHLTYACGNALAALEQHE